MFSTWSKIMKRETALVTGDTQKNGPKKMDQELAEPLRIYLQSKHGLEK